MPHQEGLKLFTTGSYDADPAKAVPFPTPLLKDLSLQAVRRGERKKRPPA
jgi:hypothetical protein